MTLKRTRFRGHSLAAYSNLKIAVLKIAASLVLITFTTTQVLQADTALLLQRPQVTSETQGKPAEIPPPEHLPPLCR